jgi:hypothetical protein
MENKKQYSVEVIETNSWADDTDNASFLWHIDSFTAGDDSVSEQFISIPYHQDFYVVLRDYCEFYEKYMLKMFSEK